MHAKFIVWRYLAIPLHFYTNIEWNFTIYHSYTRSGISKQFYARVKFSFFFFFGETKAEKVQSLCSDIGRSMSHLWAIVTGAFFVNCWNRNSAHIFTHHSIIFGSIVECRFTSRFFFCKISIRSWRVGKNGTNKSWSFSYIQMQLS